MHIKEILENHLYNIDQIRISKYCQTRYPCLHFCSFHLKDIDEWIEPEPRNVSSSDLIMFYDIMEEEDRKHVSYLLNSCGHINMWAENLYGKLVGKIDNIIKNGSDDIIRYKNIKDEIDNIYNSKKIKETIEE